MCEISVVVPFYNAKKYIRKCIDSLIHQSFYSYEIILVDDGSTDDGLFEIEDYLNNPIIRVIERDNAGTAQARKIGYEVSSGKYVQFVDADDWFENDMLSKLYNIAEKTKADMVCCGAIIENKKGKRNGVNTVAEEIRVRDRGEMLECLHYDQAVYPVIWNKLIRRDLIKNIQFPSGLYLGEDYDMVVQLVDNSNLIVQIPDVLYHYVIHGGNITKREDSKLYLLSRERYHKVIGKLLQKYPDRSVALRSFLVLQDLICLNGLIRSGIVDETIENEIVREIETNRDVIIRNESVSWANKMAVCLASGNYFLYKLIYMFYYKLNAMIN